MTSGVLGSSPLMMGEEIGTGKVQGRSADARRRRSAFTVRDIPKRERPRERLMREGPQALNREEVLAVIIGRGTAGRSVMDIAHELVVRFKTMPALAAASIEELQRVRGIGPAKACQLKAALELVRRLDEPLDPECGADVSRPETVFRLLRSEMGNERRECFWVLYLDSRSRLIGRQKISVGTLDSTMAHPREVFDGAIRAAAAAVLVAHNHPSNDPTPSDDDIRLTRRLAEAGRLLGIRLLDHVVVTKDAYFSFRERALL
ncbi:MAG: DNA repair protein RadC [candidate division WOR-3 bacterium]